MSDIQLNKEIDEFLKQAAEIAKNATCDRSRCGSVIVQNGSIIGVGYNSPPADLPDQKRCEVKKSAYDSKVTDKTCCVHAEQRAIMNALQKNSGKLKGATLYFVRLGDDGEVLDAGQPYCTICSKMALDVGIKYFVLKHVGGAKFYPTGEYNKLSFAYSV